MPSKFFAILAVTTYFLSGSICNADLILTVTDNGSGGVLVTGTGTGFTTGAGPNGGTQKWRFDDFGSNFLSNSLGTNDISATTVSGTFSNDTASNSVNIDDFAFDRDPNSNDDVEIGTSGKLSFSSGDEYSINFTAEFDSSDLAFTDVIQSVHVDSGGGSNNEIFGSVTVNVTAVPEPSSISVLVLACCAMMFYRRQS